MAFSVTLSLTGAFVVLPPDPTIAQKVLAAAGILTATTILVVLGTYIPALLAAPFQQRNALCRRIGRRLRSARPCSSAPRDRCRA